MEFILLIVGAALFYMGRIEIGSISAEGKQVKTAGIILTLPAVITFLLVQFFIPMAFGANPGAADAAAGLVDLLQLVGMLVAVALAYILIIDPPGMPRLPGLLGDIQEEARSSQPTPRPARRNKIVNIPLPGVNVRPKINRNRETFPSVMNLKEAARYLETTEEEVLKLIDDGKLTAARDNYNYKIAKSQLDELA